jgi:hypothetical protein
VLVTIELDSGEVTATAYHRFWVIQGLDLDNRPPVSHLLPTEDRGQSLPGRWVNSHELMEHDIVFIRAGGPISVRRVTHRQVNMSVCTLTIRGLHTFCVGTTQVLVHNESGTVGPINPGGAAPNKPSAATKVVNNSETTAPRPVKPSDAPKKWEDFLGPGEPTNTHPRTGVPDPDRLVSPDGTRSIRYGNHEMNSKPTKHHYHKETWTYDPVTDTMTVDNQLVRVPLQPK